MTVTIDKGDLLRDYDSYRKVTRSPFNNNSYLAYLDFLGLSQARVAGFGHVSLPEEAANRIQWLNGPNAAVLYKVWKAQNE